MIPSKDEITDALRAMNVPEELVAQFPTLPQSATGALIYGSQARGDAIVGSDLDILVLSEESVASSSSGDVSVSVYTKRQLQTGIGTLFGAHLQRDSKVLWDGNGNLTRCIESMGEVDSPRLLNRVHTMSTIFTNSSSDLPKYLPGLNRAARFLLRSSLYAQAIAEGKPCFSVREIANRLNDPQLAEILASRQTNPPQIEALRECLSRLEGIVGPFPVNPDRSLEATIVNRWYCPSDTLSMAFLALGSTGRGFDYAEIERILL